MGILVYFGALYSFLSSDVLLRQKITRINELAAALEELEGALQQREMDLISAHIDTAAHMDKITSMTYITEERTEISLISQ